MRRPARGASDGRDAMTLTIKDSPEAAGKPAAAGKPSAPSQNSESKTGQAPRANPVCLEVGVTLRSLPGDSGNSSQPIREEGRTVIVFDNGAVLRTATSLPAGQTVILSNSSGREVVCRVVTGRATPNIKGYVEVEFTEPVIDFWRIRQDAQPGAVPARPMPVVSTPSPSEPALPAATTPRVSAKPAPAETPASPTSGGAPTFEDVVGAVRMTHPARAHERRVEPAKPSLEPKTKDDFVYNIAETAHPARPRVSRLSISSERSMERSATSAGRQASSSVGRTAALPDDFLNKSLLSTPESRSSRKIWLALAIAVPVLAVGGVGAWKYLLPPNTAPFTAAGAPSASQAPAPEFPRTPAKDAPKATKAPQGTAAQEQAQTRTVAAEQPRSAPAVAPVAAVGANPGPVESAIVRKQERNANPTPPPDATPNRRPAIPSLKMKSPSAPKRTLANAGEGVAPNAEIATPESPVAQPAAGLPSAVALAPNQPAPPGPVFAPATPSAAPASAPAARITSEPRLVSSTRPVYPASARASKVQGNVVVSASIDATGKVANAKALSGPMLLQQAALESVRQWKYSPALADGRPVSSQVTVNVEFRLQ